MTQKQKDESMPSTRKEEAHADPCRGAEIQRFFDTLGLGTDEQREAMSFRALHREPYPPRNRPRLVPRLANNSKVVLD